MNIKADISIGELIDKITILQIKSERIKEETKLVNVRKELLTLENIKKEIESSNKLIDFSNELKDINEALWIIEDKIRECERNQDFSDRFIELARQVYITNDQRSEIKRKINEITNSNLIEEKSYTSYK